MQQSLILAAILGLIHAVIDGSTVSVVFSTSHVHGVSMATAALLVLAYDILAFAGQPFLGLLADKIGNMRAVIIAGIILTAFSVGLMKVSPVGACISAGIGNALFHLGAGAVCIFIKRGKAAPTGVFVGPGALGLAFGIWMGKSQLVWVWPFIGALAVALVVAILIPLPQTHKIPGDDPGVLSRRFARPWLGLGLLMSSIFFRSLVGHAGSYACPKTTVVLFGLAGAACVGKVFGGLICDKLGWIRVSTLVLAISLPFIAFGQTNPLIVGIGLCFFQMTTAVTLVAIAMLFPRFPAFAFGLNCLAFILGALPTFYPPFHSVYSPMSFSVVIILSVATVYLGLTVVKDGLTTS